jgi:hypothetical protein
VLCKDRDFADNHMSRPLERQHHQTLDSRSALFATRWTHVIPTLHRSFLKSQATRNPGQSRGPIRMSKRDLDLCPSNRSHSLTAAARKANGLTSDSSLAASRLRQAKGGLCIGAYWVLSP